MSHVVNDFWRTAITPLRRDPLAIDLDGDGIETVGLGVNPVLFDHNADGIKTGTGWLSGDDAWLVRDLDGNGSVDSGRELFGVDTLVYSIDPVTGAIVRRTAATGFEALGALDSNRDGVFNGVDAAFGELRLWRDLNGNGISDAGELLSLAEAGIASISLNASNIATNLGNGNTVTGTATVQRIDGGQTQVNSVDLTAGNLNLADNPFYREFTDPIALTEAALALPDVGGSGVVRNLREAMSGGTSAAAALTQAVQAFAGGATRDEQRALMTPLLHAWAATESSNAIRIEPVGDETRRFYVQLSTDAALQARLNSIIPVLEAFNGASVDQAGWVGNTTTVDGCAITSYVMVSMQSDAMLRAYEVLTESVYRSLVLQTRLRPYMDAIELVVDEQGVRFDTTALHGLLQSTYETDAQAGLEDLAELCQFAASTLLGVGYDGMATLRGWVESLPADSALREQFAALDLCTSPSTVGTNRAEIYLGDGTSNFSRGGVGDDALDGGGGNDYLYGDADHDHLFGRDGNDRLSGGDGNDTLVGGANDDSLWGDAGDDALEGSDGVDTLYGGDGNDTLEGGAGDDSFDGGAGNDTLEGGAGNDFLEGGSGDDVFLFGRGDGQDTIRPTYDGNPNMNNVLQFREGVLPADVTFRQASSGHGIGADVELTITGTTDRVTVQGFFAQNANGTSSAPVQQIRFADGTVWTSATLLPLIFAGTPDADTITGASGSDAITGGTGNDTLNGMGGNDAIDGGQGSDTLSGGEGNDALVGGDDADTLYGEGGDDQLAGGAGVDRLYGGGGNDTLGGGAGNDTLDGGVGNDTYIFGRGDGQDVITPRWDNGAVRTGVLRFGASIAPADIVVRQVNVSGNGAGADLEFSIAGSTDRITIYGSSQPNTSAYYYGVQQIEFADGTVWQMSAILPMLFAGTTAADNIVGTSNADRISSLAGNDVLSGLAGNDVLDGGQGADTLYGGEGHDGLYGGDDNDVAYGDAGDDVLDGGAGDDIFRGGVGNDVVLGGGGNDSLYGEAGNDTLAGGEGNDRLTGGGGNDTYLFGRGDGQDTIRATYDTTAIKGSVLQFAESVSAADIVLRQTGDTGYGSAANLELSIAGTTDKVTIEGFLQGDNPTNAYNPVQLVRFADGTTWDMAAVLSVLHAGTVGADVVTGTINADNITGQAGNDVLSGAAGNDMLDGGHGLDTLNGDAGDDTLIGGMGNDTLHGGTGNNTFVFGRGDGQDLIRSSYDSNTLRRNVLQLREGIVPADIVLRQVAGGADLEVGIAGTTDKVVIQGFLTGSVVNGTGNPVQQIRFADGTVWDTATLLSIVFAGSEAADTISGTTGADTIRGAGGSDTLGGAAGNDVLYGERGLDTLYGGDGSDVLNGGEDADTLYGDAGDDQFAGGAGNDRMYGGAGNDTLNGDDGNDTLYGGTGNDTFMFGRGGGQDVILGDDNAAGRVDVLQLREGVSPADLVLRQVAGGADLEVSIAGTPDKITVGNYMQGGNPNHNYSPIQQIRFHDGTTWSTTNILQVLYTGTAGADTLYGTINADVVNGGAGIDTLFGGNGDDVLYGGADKDTLDGGWGADILEGGTGNDSLLGGAGSDTYRFSRGAGADVVTDSDGTEGSDLILFGESIATDQLWFRNVGNSLEITVIGTTDKVVINNWFGNSAFRVEQIRTADGSTLQHSQVQNLVSAMAGFAPPPMGQMTLPSNYQASLGGTIAANWTPPAGG